MRFLLTMFTFFAVVWCAAFVGFLMSIPGPPPPITQKAPALVVLTGGYARIEHGLELLADGESPVLFISGVNDHVTKQQILKDYANADLRVRVAASGGEIVLDQIARSTRGNAEQTALFLKERHITTIRLITANYHMHRALREFHHVMPEVTIIPDPVSPKEYERSNWWKYEVSRRVIFGEFYKSFGVLLRDWLKSNATPN